MATKIDILTTGYAELIKPKKTESADAEQRDSSAQHNNGKFMRATGSCCLVSSNQTYTLFDTMGPWERDILANRLAALKIHPDDIEYLVCSHSHPDHIGNLNLFTKAKKHFVGTSVYTSDVYDLNCFEPTGSHRFKSKKHADSSEIEVINYESYQLDRNLIIQPTQGHTMECVSLIVKNCDTYGTVGLAGDLFECESDVDDESIWLAAGSQNPNLQRANRARLYSQVDYILPGHGKLFKTLEQTEF